MEITQIINSQFLSNTFLITNKDEQIVWLIDIGDIESIIVKLKISQTIKGVFLTHAHFDHIYGINKLIEYFPECIIYTSNEGRNDLYSDKLNLSYYYEEPIIFLGSNIQILQEDKKIKLFENCFLQTLETPGHNWGCLSYKVENYLFTGDSYIPNVDVVTKLKGGDKEANKKSLKKIMDNVSENTIICPGHGVIAQSINKTFELGTLNISNTVAI